MYFLHEYIYFQPILNIYSTENGGNNRLFIKVHENIIIIGDPTETDISDRRPIGDRHAVLKNHRRPRHASSETHLKPTCPIYYSNIYKQSKRI